MISGLWNHPKNATPMGTATTGSSEAIMLGGMSMKRRWQAKMKAAGKDIHNPGPNIIMGAEAQVALEKFARYFEVEARLVPITEDSNYVMDPEKVLDYVDENVSATSITLPCLSSHPLPACTLCAMRRPGPALAEAIAPSMRPLCVCCAPLRTV